MNRGLFLCAGLMLALSAHAAEAQVFGQFGAAPPIGMNTRLAGGFVSFSKSETEGLGQLRLSFYPGVDFGFQGGLSRVSVLGHNRTSIQLGGDLKAKLAKQTETFPIDLSVGGGIGVYSADDFTVLSVGPSIVASRTLALSNGTELAPYAGLSVLFSRSDAGSTTANDTATPLRLGAEYRPNVDVRFIAELQIGVSDDIRDDLKFTLGANFPF